MNLCLKSSDDNNAETNLGCYDLFIFGLRLGLPNNYNHFNWGTGNISSNSSALFFFCLWFFNVSTFVCKLDNHYLVIAIIQISNIWTLLTEYYVISMFSRWFLKGRMALLCTLNCM